MCVLSTQNLGENASTHKQTSSIEWQSMSLPTSNETLCDTFRWESSCRLGHRWYSFGRLSGPWIYINAEIYCRMLKRLSGVIRKKRLVPRSRGRHLLHENGGPYKAQRTENMPAQVWRNVLQHPPYISKLAPQLFHFFPTLTDGPDGLRFTKTAVKCHPCSDSTPRSYFHTCQDIDKLIKRVRKCLHPFSEYVNKKVRK
jgi:hypothetical protein